MDNYIKIFPNTYKKKGSNQPDYIAYLSKKNQNLQKIGSMWKRESKTGNFYYSLILETDGELLKSSLSLKEKKEKKFDKKIRYSKMKLRKGRTGK